MASMCLHCKEKPVAGLHRYYCSTTCMRAFSRARRSQEIFDARYKIISSGHDIISKALFDKAEESILCHDPRAWYYRLILELVDGKPCSVPFDAKLLSRDCQTIIFPEPNRRSHIDANSIRRPGDVFTLRSPFEWPAVPVEAYYRVQLFGYPVQGQIFELIPNDTDASKVLYVRLPPCLFYSDRWKSSNWGSQELPAHRLRQIERRKKQKSE